MKTKKMYCRYLRSDIQLEKYIECNAITREEIFSISPYTSYHGNGMYDTGQNLYFFTERTLSFDLFHLLNDFRQQQLEAKFKKFRFDKNFKAKVQSDQSINILLEKGIIYKGVTNKRNFISHLIFHTEEKNEPTDYIELFKVIADLNPYLVNYEFFF